MLFRQFCTSVLCYLVCLFDNWTALYHMISCTNLSRDSTQLDQSVQNKCRFQITKLGFILFECVLFYDLFVNLLHYFVSLYPSDSYLAGLIKSTSFSQIKIRLQMIILQKSKQKLCFNNFFIL